MVSEANMHKLLVKEAQLTLTQCNTISIQHVSSESRENSVDDQLFVVTAELPVKIAEVLHSFAQIFQERKGLPSFRQNDHQINFKRRSQPVSLRPYRYGALQKDIIEKLTQELLDAGVIQYSYSPFFAPVVLVRKKDNSWRLCIDYRGLNQITIKDKFSKPIIEELLEELMDLQFLLNWI